MQGRARSCSILAAYIMKLYNLSVQNTIDFIIGRRPEAFFFGKSINFDWSLKQYRDKTQGTDKK
jgi:protein-tyrosine phosphatase